jgi:hypothetical protein
VLRFLSWLGWGLGPVASALAFGVPRLAGASVAEAIGATPATPRHATLHLLNHSCFLEVPQMPRGQFRQAPHLRDGLGLFPWEGKAYCAEVLVSG